MRYTATSKNPNGWSARGRRFAPTIDLSACTDLAFWLHGDGKGETLYLQLRDTAGKWFDAKTKIDFTGWKYVEFPLAGAKADLSKIEYLIIYYNAIPAGATVTCRVDDVRGIRKTMALTNPSVTVNGQKLIGSAQMRGRKTVLQHGALPLRGDIARICAYLTTSTDPARVRSHATTLERVLGHTVPWEQAATAMATGFEQALNLRLQPGDLSPTEEQLVKELSASKYSAEAWTARC